MTIIYKIGLFIGALFALFGCHHSTIVNTHNTAGLTKEVQFDSITVDFSHIDSLDEAIIFPMESRIPRIFDSIFSKIGDVYNKHLGWVDLPSTISEKEIIDIEQTALELRKISDVVVIVGIGGSYHGARSVIEALSNHFAITTDENPTIVYAGNNMSEEYLYDLLSYLYGKDFSIVVISKSGTTLETALAFRVLKNRLDSIYRDEASDRIVAITGKGTPLDSVFYKTYYIPDDIGGRFSVLTPVGLLPIAISGFNIREFINGAKHIEIECRNNQNSNNPVAQYAIARQALHESGKTTEIMVNYEPRMAYFAEWWKQLYGESLGKKNKGMFPTSVIYSTDLHSMGQYIQGCPNSLIETVISIKNPRAKLLIPFESNDYDKLNYLAGKRISEINHIVEDAVSKAHYDGGVPSIHLTIPSLSEYTLGELMYFFELSCAINGYLMGINPFDQPNVDEYKKILKNNLTKNQTNN